MKNIVIFQNATCDVYSYPEINVGFQGYPWPILDNE